MNRLALAIWIGALLAMSGLAQSRSGAQADGTAAASGNAQAAEGSAALASGATLNATLDKSLDSKKCKPGDTVKASSMEDVKSNGKTVLPKGTKLVGHVTEASAKAKGDSQSAIGIAFDKAVLKHGEEVRVNLAIQAIGPAASSANAYAAAPDTGPAGSMGGPSSAPSSGGAPGMGGGRASSSAPNTTSSSGGSVTGPVSSASGSIPATTQGAEGGLSATGPFASNSRGIFGLEGLSLRIPSPNDNAQGSVIASNDKHVQLDSGTRLLLVSQAAKGGGGK